MIKTARLLLLGLLLGLPGWLAAQAPNISRVDPPFWWVGMAHHQVELLVHGPDIADSRPSIDYPGVTLLEDTRVENPNYLFLQINIAPDAQPGEVPIVFTQGKQALTVAYQLRGRRQPLSPLPTLSSEDFIYLIMPDRFANGDLSNDVVPSMLQPEAQREGILQRHGGDLQGIIDQLGYFEELGVTALWLNPPEENDQPHESYHGYAITDHYRIDPRFGDNDTYLELVEKAHERGIKVVRDVIYNHVGDQHYFIQDLPSQDWVHQFDTFTKTTYRAPTLMDPYASEQDRRLMSDGWFDKHMPDLNQDNPHVARYLIQNSLWWIEHFGVDAYRIDTYAYPDQRFMAEWAKAIKREYPDFMFFGETWVHGTPIQAWFTSHAKNKPFDSHLPGITDFQLQYAIIDALNQDFGWTSGLTRLYYILAQDYLYDDPYQNVTFLDNHDLNRFYSVIGEDMNKFYLGMGFLLTTRGIPMIYYGTEILMPDSEKRTHHDKHREEFAGGWPGDEIDKFRQEGRTPEEQQAFAFTATLANFRKQSSALTTGKLMQFVPEAGVYVYFRYDEQQTVMVAMNQNQEAKPLDSRRYAERMEGFSSARDIPTGQRYRDLGQLEVPGMGILVLELER
jgi:neopullulanase